VSSVSVVIPCYKYGHFLEQAVASVLDDQPGVDVSVLIIDDASPDDSADVAHKIAARDPRVQVLVHETNKGNIATYNEGLLEWADGDYSVLMSADDRLTPGALERATDLLDAHPEVGFVYGHPIWFWENKPLPAARTKVRGWSVWSGRSWMERVLKQAENCITSPEVVVRTSVQKQVGGYEPTLPHSADQEMWLRLAAHADVGFLQGPDQAFYRVHSNNMRKGFDAVRDLEQKRLAFEVTLDRYAGLLPNAEGLSRNVHRKLSREALRIACRAYEAGRQDDVPVAELIDFALDCWPPSKKSALYHALLLRRRLGASVVMRVPLFRVSAFARRAIGWLQRRSWKYRGL